MVGGEARAVLSQREATDHVSGGFRHEGVAIELRRIAVTPVDRGGGRRGRLRESPIFPQHPHGVSGHHTGVEPDRMHFLVPDDSFIDAGGRKQVGMAQQVADGNEVRMQPGRIHVGKDAAEIVLRHAPVSAIGIRRGDESAVAELKTFRVSRVHHPIVQTSQQSV